MKIRIGNIECEIFTDQLHTQVVLKTDGSFGSADMIANELIRILGEKK